uniref:Large ribosomal subunit protein mL45 n=1 Tax=Anas platyrhynchos TaxID=8839 RepID=A0A8B9Z905_ANAPL
GGSPPAAGSVPCSAPCGWWQRPCCSRLCVGLSAPSRGGRAPCGWPHSYFILKDVFREESFSSSQGAASLLPSSCSIWQFLSLPTSLLCLAADIIDPYVPPEGDARMSSLSKDGLKQRVEKLNLRKVKDHVPDFSTKTFPEKAQEIFIEAHNCLANFNKQKLHSLVTERCYPVSLSGRTRPSGWSFVESLEPPRVVHIRCNSMVNPSNLYGQVTVRMHTRQTLAVYDRFGRLMYGGEQVPKDVLEYVVFERYLVNPYGTWRMHGKIVPEWAPPKDPIIKTVMIPGPALDSSQEIKEHKEETSEQVQRQQ